MNMFLRLCLFVFLVGCAQHETRPTTTEQAPFIANKHIADLVARSLVVAPSKAVRDLAAQIAQDTNNPEPLYAMGYAHMQNTLKHKTNDEHDLALDYFNEALILLPGNIVVLRAIYSIYYSDTLRNHHPKAFDDAKDIFFKIPDIARVDMNPPSLARFALIASWQESQHRVNRPVLAEILLDAIHEQPLNDIAYLQLATIYMDEEHYALALATLKLGAEKIQNSADIYKAIGSTYETRAESGGCNYEFPKDITAASEFYKSAIAVTPDSEDLHLDLARTFFDQHLDQLGIHETQLVLATNASAKNLAGAAQNYAMIGNTEKSKAYFSQAIQAKLAMEEVSYHELSMDHGDWKLAAASFNKYIKAKNTFSVYDLIKSDMIAHELSQESLLKNQTISTNSPWEKNLYNYWKNTISSDQLEQRAQSRCEKTEFYFYSGYRDLNGGNAELAKQKFHLALNQNTFRFIERPLARYFLNDK